MQEVNLRVLKRNGKVYRKTLLPVKKRSPRGLSHQLPTELSQEPQAFSHCCSAATGTQGLSASEDFMRTSCARDKQAVLRPTNGLTYFQLSCEKAR